MKKILLTLTFMLSFLTFAHEHHHEEVKLENAVNYHSVKGALHTDLSIGTHEGELHAKIGEFGMVDVEKTENGYETANKLITIQKTKNGAHLKVAILLFDRSDYNSSKFEKEMNFHSYNGGFPHFHVDFLNKEYTKVRLQQEEGLTFNGKMTVNEETKDRVFTEEKGRFTIILFSKYDDNKKMEKNLTRTAMFISEMDLTKLANHHHKH
ncbi:hypothetical protein [Sneathia vaginalis]|uniref:hypothetical protein n=1 Tax=Sneathia vaginalis TaxID=187101 RepID=UPI00288A25C3|nr:hypothetical protein [Sneathia vaginalis]